MILWAAMLGMWLATPAVAEEINDELWHEFSVIMDAVAKSNPWLSIAREAGVRPRRITCVVIRSRPRR